jgi:hypothetical protein
VIYHAAYRPGVVVKFPSIVRDSQENEMETLNDEICCEPFSFTGLEKERRASGLIQVSNYVGLVGLKVLAGGCGLAPGDTVLVKGTDVKSPYGMARLKLLDGRECIFVPKSAVKLVVRKNDELH